MKLPEKVFIKIELYAHYATVINCAIFTAIMIIREIIMYFNTERKFIRILHCKAFILFRCP